MIYKFLFFIGLLFCTITAQAQVYTADNTVRIYIEGTDQLYEYTSDKLMVRLNDETQKIECILPIESLVPANVLSPQVLAYDVFFEQKYPLFQFQFNAPIETLNKQNLNSEPMQLTGKVQFQGRDGDQIFPTVFMPYEESFSFRTNFNFTIQAMEGTLPRKYKTMLTGFIRVQVLNATWVRPVGAPNPINR
ncbi:MAG: hypothetical protein LPK19_11065 [Hymenobacteraceae bacterium]|nr:hypothetical protein [Hymenobacteraceae bacterium]MDX5396773.1 hypothetical protein [Hymenobacteraceae bacterium]MDX5512836.1 hypothetical protein [Hymenobacteraceae bacterium]